MSFKDGDDVGNEFWNEISAGSGHSGSEDEKLFKNFQPEYQRAGAAVFRLHVGLETKDRNRNTLLNQYFSWDYIISVLFCTSPLGTSDDVVSSPYEHYESAVL